MKNSASFRPQKNTLYITWQPWNLLSFSFRRFKSWENAYYSRHIQVAFLGVAFEYYILKAVKK